MDIFCLYYFFFYIFVIYLSIVGKNDVHFHLPLELIWLL